MPELIITDENFEQFLADDLVDGLPAKHFDGYPRLMGCLPRGSSPTYHGAAGSIKPLPKTDWPNAIAKAKSDGVFLRDIATKLGLKADNQNGHGTCFPAGTLIRMGDGSQKPIEDIRVLDEVLTAETNIRHVAATMVKREPSELCRLVLLGHSHLTATANHPILTRRGYVPVEELVAGDLVAIPKFAVGFTQWINARELIAGRVHVRRKTRRTRTFAGVAGRKALTTVIDPVPDIIHLTAGFGRIVGLFIAEGSTDQQRVNWTFNAKERDTLASELVGLLKSELDLTAVLRDRPNNVCQVTLYGVEWAKLFESLCGHGAENKHLGEMASGPLPFLDGVFSGWVDGDHRDDRSAVTVSHRLAMEMFDIANVLGLKPRIGLHGKDRIDKSGQHHRASWLVAWTPRGTDPSGWASRTINEPSAMWREVVRVERLPFNGWVYNLSVEGDNSYVAEGIGVHNCWMHGPANAVRMWRAARGFKTIMLCAESALPETGRGLNSGGSIDDSARAMEIGYCDVAFSSGPYDSPNSRFKDGWKENRKLHSATRIIELGQSGDMLGEYVACAVAGIPVVCDWNWWRHCTLGATDARITNGNLEVGIWNSWDVSWGENGFGYLSGRKTIPDAAFAVLDCVNSPA